MTAPSVNAGIDITTLDAADCILRPDGSITIRFPCDTLVTISAPNGVVGTAIVNGMTTVTYTPNDMNSCNDLFTYKISDNNGNMVQSTVQIISDGDCPAQYSDVILRNNFDGNGCSCPTQ